MNNIKKYLKESLTANKLPVFIVELYKDLGVMVAATT